jgi:hypothetical protein
MSRGPTTFRQRDVTAAVRAARAAGIEVARVEVDRSGKITVIAGQPSAEGQITNSDQHNEWDDWLAVRRNQKGKS